MTGEAQLRGGEAIDHRDEGQPHEGVDGRSKRLDGCADQLGGGHHVFGSERDGDLRGRPRWGPGRGDRVDLDSQSGIGGDAAKLRREPTISGANHLPCLRRDERQAVVPAASPNGVAPGHRRPLLPRTGLARDIAKIAQEICKPPEVR